MSGDEQVPSFDSMNPYILAENSARISRVVNDFNIAFAQGFKLEESAGQDLLRVIDHMISVSQKVLQNSWPLAQEPKLGNTPAALVYKPFLATIATDKVHGFIPAVQRLLAGLENLRSNIKQSINTYQNVEAVVSGDMKDPGN